MGQNSHIDKGDRVVITGNSFCMGSHDLSEHQGKHGIVEFNNGWGLCNVRFDDGTTVRAWNGADLELEEQ